ncbi:hypothetical protein [Flammeovirga sp. SubArs3]|uniref:hypothetical protein n=1 Tax=Flammeovirga sp. SubArs3 TaxID=2995316 RepID=UPI00248C4DA9|nr:hypothetical protein [Flammeovirga sp. SubArs3]
MKYIKYLWGLSLLIYLGLALLAYIYLPDEGVTVLHQTASSEALILTKNAFFYASMGSLMLVNIFFVTIGNGILYFPKPMILAPNSSFWLNDSEHREVFLEKMKGWTKGMATIFNFLLLTVLGVIYAEQGHDPYAIKVEYSPMILWVIALVWMGAYFVVFKKTAIEED